MVKAVINNTEYDVSKDFSIAEQSGNKTSSTITVEVPIDKAIPNAGDTIQLVNDDGALFWGVCGIPTSPEYSTGCEVRAYKIKCNNANALLSFRVANVAYQNRTVEYIVHDLFDRYIAAEGITLGRISPSGTTMKIYTAKDIDVQTVLNELADLAGAVWTIDQDRVFSFVVIDDFPQFPLLIQQGMLFGKLQHTTKNYKTRTVQIISGATDNTAIQTETFTYDMESPAFSVTFPIAREPIIYVNGQVFPPSQVGVVGINDADSTINFFWSYNAQTITYRDTEGYILPNGAKIKIQYTGLFPIRIVAQNDEKIVQIAEKTGTSGRREIVKHASNVSTQADAQALALSLLDRFAESQAEIKWTFPTDSLYKNGMTLANTALNTKVTFNLPNLGIVGDFVIVERSFTPLYADLSRDFGRRLMITLKLTNSDYLKGYGETISSIKTSVNQLSVREDEQVVQTMQNADKEQLSEIVQLTAVIAPFPVDSAAVNQFAPLPLSAEIYPI